VKATGRKQLVLAALWTEICLAMPALQALGEGYDVFVVTDASGGVSAEAHEMAVRRMVAAGAVPMTWLAVLGEWQRDWARESTAAGVAGVVAEHGARSVSLIEHDTAFRGAELRFTISCSYDATSRPPDWIARCDSLGCAGQWRA
jgi:nicotinamidase-related amidase